MVHERYAFLSSDLPNYAFHVGRHALHGGKPRLWSACHQIKLELCAFARKGEHNVYSLVFNIADCMYIYIDTKFSYDNNVYFSIFCEHRQLKHGIHVVYRPFQISFVTLHDCTSGAQVATSGFMWLKVVLCGFMWLSCFMWLSGFMWLNGCMWLSGFMWLCG